MEDVIQQLISNGPVGMLCASLVYIIIHFQRKSTGEKRDSQNESLDKRITLLEHDVEFIKEQNHVFGNKLDKILEELTNIKVELAQKQNAGHNK